MYAVLGVIPIVFIVLYILFIRKMHLTKSFIYLGINILVCVTLFYICYQVVDKPIEETSTGMKILDLEEGVIEL